MTSKAIDDLADQYGVWVSSVIEWVAVTHTRDFHEEPDDKKRAWVRLYAEAHGYATAPQPIAVAGELLIRALATLGTLSEVEQASYKPLIQQVSLALESAAQLHPQVAESLRTHPPSLMQPVRS